jgi:hypothetical protein
MNERIRDLKEQSLLWAIETLDPDALNDNEWGVAIDGKFAELIVTECAAIINDIPSSPQGSWSDGYYEGCRDSAKQIKQDFGIKE